MRRSTAILMIGACLTAASPANAQVIKARGAAAAGVCAGALDMLGGFASRLPDTSKERLANIQKVRDFFSELPQYDNAEIQDNATAFVNLMTDRYAKTQTAAEQKSITSEIVQVATGCLVSAQPRTLIAPESIPELLIAPDNGTLLLDPLPAQ